MMLTISYGNLFAQGKPLQWKEMEDFHVLVAPVFHAAEKGNFQNARDSAGLVLERAKKWQAAAIPSGLDAAIFKPLISRLVLECIAITDAVKANKPDADLKPVLRKAHNTFHEILAKYNQLAPKN